MNVWLLKKSVYCHAVYSWHGALKSVQNSELVKLYQVINKFTSLVLLILFDLSVIFDPHSDYLYCAWIHTYARSNNVSNMQYKISLCCNLLRNKWSISFETPCTSNYSLAHNEFKVLQTFYSTNIYKGYKSCQWAFYVEHMGG